MAETAYRYVVCNNTQVGEKLAKNMKKRWYMTNIGQFKDVKAGKSIFFQKILLNHVII